MTFADSIFSLIAFVVAAAMCAVDVARGLVQCDFPISLAVGIGYVVFDFLVTTSVLRARWEKRS